MVDGGDLVTQQVLVLFVEGDALVDDRLVVAMKRDAARLKDAWALEVAGLDFEVDDVSEGTEAGILSAEFTIKGRYAYGLMAGERGVRIVVSTDAHSVRGLENMRLAVHTARRGWATAADVVNTRPLSEVLGRR